MASVPKTIKIQQVLKQNIDKFFKATEFVDWLAVQFINNIAMPKLSKAFSKSKGFRGKRRIRCQYQKTAIKIIGNKMAFMDSQTFVKPPF